MRFNNIAYRDWGMGQLDTCTSSVQHKINIKYGAGVIMTPQCMYSAYT